MYEKFCPFIKNDCINEKCAFYNSEIGVCNINEALLDLGEILYIMDDKGVQVDPSFYEGE